MVIPVSVNTAVPHVGVFSVSRLPFALGGKRRACVSVLCRMDHTHAFVGQPTVPYICAEAFNG